MFAFNLVLLILTLALITFFMLPIKKLDDIIEEDKENGEDKEDDPRPCKGKGGCNACKCSPNTRHLF